MKPIRLKLTIPFAITILILLNNNCYAQQSTCPIIPQPAKAVKAKGVFTLSQYTPIIINSNALHTIAGFLQNEVLKSNKIPLAIQDKSKLPPIRIQLFTAKNSAAENYQLRISPSQILISAGTTKGAFNGIVSLLQLIKTQQETVEVKIPGWDIEDKPMYSWRGLMLDESRHFFGKETVKQLLDWMAFYKLNTFHWHLTDEPGWRLEIKKYPLLALVGGIGSYTNAYTEARFYTQEDIREIVSYAKERFITIIPEVDMPGHATAANRAYPQYSGGGNDKHPDFTFNPGKEQTYEYLTAILREVNALFPSQMLHIGGDEVHYGNDKWMSDPDVQKLMQKNKLKDAVGVERYFMERMADTILSMNTKILAWDEAAAMDLPRDKAILFWWRHDQPQQLQKALERNYKVVICPRLPFYFDFVQDSTHTVGRKWGKLYNSLESVYQFDVGKLKETKYATGEQILGIQANVWTETMTNKRQLQYMIFPRIAALANVAWATPGRNNYKEFYHHLKQQYKLYKQAGINFYAE